MKKIKIPFLTAIIAICTFSCSSDSETTEEKKPVDQETISGVEKPNEEQTTESLDKLIDDEVFINFINTVNIGAKKIDSNNIPAIRDLLNKGEEKTTEEKDNLAQLMGFENAVNLDGFNKTQLLNWQKVWTRFGLKNQDKKTIDKIFNQALYNARKFNTPENRKRSAKNPEIPEYCWERFDVCTDKFYLNEPGFNIPGALYDDNCGRFVEGSAQGDLCINDVYNQLAIEEAERIEEFCFCIADDGCFWETIVEGCNF